MRAELGACLLMAAAACTSGSSGPEGSADAAVSGPDRVAPPAPDAGPPAPDATAPDPDASVDPDAGAPPDLGPPPAPSARTLSFKRFDQLRLELQRVLALAPGDLCRELDRFDCANEVHRVALGGSDPYFANVYVPAREPPLNGPLAWERVVLTACAERVDRDLAAPAEAAWLMGLDVGAQGRVDPSSAAFEAAVRRLIREALLRDPSAEEVDGWREAYREIENESGPEPARTWARVVCGAVLTSGEFVFY